MPIVTISFSLPDEDTNHLCAVHGLRFHRALRDIDEHLRQLLKHGTVNHYTSKRLAEEIMAMIQNDLSLVKE